MSPSAAEKMRVDASWQQFFNFSHAVIAAACAESRHKSNHSIVTAADEVLPNGGAVHAFLI
jgi:hypothetical protein